MILEGLFRPHLRPSESATDLSIHEIVSRIYITALEIFILIITRYPSSLLRASWVMINDIS